MINFCEKVVFLFLHLKFLNEQKICIMGILLIFIAGKNIFLGNLHYQKNLSSPLIKKYKYLEYLRFQ